MESAFGPSTTSHTQLRVLLVEDLPRRSFFVTVDGLPRSSLSFDPVQSHWMSIRAAPASTLIRQQQTIREFQIIWDSLARFHGPFQVKRDSPQNEQ